MNATTPRIDILDSIANRDRVRLLRTQRYLSVAVLAAVACILVVPAVPTLPSFVMLNLLVGVVLCSLARALDARLGYLWGRLYPEPEQSTRFDRYVDHIMHRLVVPRIDESHIRVRPLDPPEC